MKANVVKRIYAYKMREAFRVIRTTANFRATAAMFFAGAALVSHLHTSIARADDDSPSRGYTVDEFTRALGLVRAAELGTKPDDFREGTASSAQLHRHRFHSALGEVIVRWPSELRSLVSGSSSPAHSASGGLNGKFPGESTEIEESVREAWTVASNVIAHNGFPWEMEYDSIDWNLVLRSGAPVLKRQSLLGSQGCQAAWMGPPADIVVDLRRIMEPCDAEGAADFHRGSVYSLGSVSSRARASVRLRDSLVHEIGHAIEFHLLGPAFSYRERWHGEGFASWFETLGVRELPPGDSSRADLREVLRERARRAFAKPMAKPAKTQKSQTYALSETGESRRQRPVWNTAVFDGSADDYARSYVMIATIAEVYGPSKLFEAYRTAAADRVSLREAVKRLLSIDEERWIQLSMEHLSR